MFQQLRKKLIFLYTATTGLLLFIILAGSYFLSVKQLNSHCQSQFETLFYTISNEVMSTNQISHLWLSKMEASNQLVIGVESNAVPISFQGSWTPDTNRQILLSKLSKLSGNYFSFSDLLSQNRKQSPIYSFYGEQGEHYYGCAAISFSSSNYRKLFLIRQLVDEKEQLFSTFLFHLFLYAAGLVFLFLISRIFVSRTLIPLKIGLKRQSEFIAAASHELRSPLTVIRAGIHAIHMAPEKAEEFIPPIDREGERMSRLIEELLLLASQDAKVRPLKKEWIPMDTFLISAYDSLSALCLKKEQILDLKLPEEELSPFFGDSQCLQQLFMILIDNASSYSPEKSHIILKAAQRKGQLQFSVIDHGPGVANEDKKRIFERFYRSNQARNDKTHFGLGLSIAINLVEQHHGKIMVKDTPGGGATFLVTFPLSARPIMD